MSISYIWLAVLFGPLFSYWFSAYIFISYSERSAEISKYYSRLVYFSSQVYQFLFHHFEDLLLKTGTVKLAMSS